MALQVVAPGQGAQAQLGQFQMQVPQFQNFGEAKLADPVGKTIRSAVDQFTQWAIQKGKQRDEEDVAAAVTDLQKQALQFQSDWKGSHFGVEARDAGKIFSQNVDETALRMVDERFKGRPELAAAFRSRAAQISFSGFSSGTAYDDQQDLQYRKDQLEGQKNDLNAIVANGTDEQINQAVQNYKATRDAFFPGMDYSSDDFKLSRGVHLGLVTRELMGGNMSGAMSRLQAGVKAGVLSPDDVYKARTQIETGVVNQVNGAIASGRTDEAAALIEDGIGDAGKIIKTHGVAHSSADRNNPFGIGGKGGYRTYSSPEAGVRAADRLLRGSVYIGSGINTPAAIITKWAPPSENNTKKYIADVCNMTGLKPDAVINPNTEEGRAQLDRMISAMAMAETSWKITPEQVKACREGLGGGLTPDQRNRLLGAAEKIPVVEQRQDVIGHAKAFTEQLIGSSSQYLDATHEERVTAMEGLLETLPEDVRVKVQPIVKSNLDRFRAVQGAQAITQARSFQEYAKQQGWTPKFAETQIDGASNLNYLAKEKLHKIYQGKANTETPENRQAYTTLLKRIDLGPENGGIDGSDEVAVQAECERLGLTFTQTDKVTKYASNGGRNGTLTTTMFDRAYKMLHPDAKSKDLQKARGDMFDLVTQAAGQDPGKPFTVQAVKSAIALLETQGEDPNTNHWFVPGVGRDMTYADYLKDGNGDKPFVPDVKGVPAEDAYKIVVKLKNEGVKNITPERIAQYFNSNEYDRSAE